MRDNKMTIHSKEDLLGRKIEIDLTGPEGNAFCLLGIGAKLVRKINKIREGHCMEPLNWDKIRDEMTSGEYDNLVEVFDKYFGDYVELYR
jgi:hypothetical protein